MAATPSPVQAGLQCRCPACGSEPVFETFLTLRSVCPACNADFSCADSGDAPAFFVMFIVLILIAPTAMIIELALQPPVWAHLLIWTPLVIGSCMLLLRPVKSLLFALQWQHDAHEGRQL